VSLQISSVGPSNRMPPGWYFTFVGDEIWDDNLASHLYGNVGINGLDEWSVEKLGWYKSPKSFKNHNPGFHNGGQVSLRTLQQIRESFHIRTDDCIHNLNTFQFTSQLLASSDTQLKSARRVADIYPFIKKLKIWRRHVEVSHKESPLLALTMQHQSKVDVTMRFEESALEDFRGQLVVDTNSNIMLNLTLFNGKGSLNGQVHGFNTSQAIQVLIPSNSPSQFTQALRLGEAVTCIPPKGQVRVTLHPFGQKSSEISRMIPCLEDGLRKFRHIEDSGNTPANALSPQDYTTGGHSWMDFINPLTWVADSGLYFDNSTSKIVILVITSVVALLTFVCLIKCCLCIKKCCSS